MDDQVLTNLAMTFLMLFTELAVARYEWRGPDAVKFIRKSG